MRKDTTNLRSSPPLGMIRRCLRAVRARSGFRVVHFSVQSNHLHLVVEADDEVELARGMQALAIRIAKALNAALGRKGPVFADHYFAEQMRSPAQVRHTLRYVLRNAAHHGVLDGVDSRATEVYFAVTAVPEEAPVSLPRTWLLTIGWRRAKGRAWPPPAAADVS